MADKSRVLKATLASALAGLLLAGCPLGQQQLEFIPGGTGQSSRLGSTPSVDVLSPIADLAINGGTAIELNWITVATTNFAAVDVFFDLDQDPNNDNEIYAERSLGFNVTSALLDTSSLEAATYYLGVTLRERNQIAAFGYADGRLIVNQRVQFFFDSGDPNTGCLSLRDNHAFDRTAETVPCFDVRWQLLDPDSTVSVQILLDPDDTPNGNEFLLRESDEQRADGFQFSLPTAQFEAGTYRVLAIVTTDVGSDSFYSPGVIQLRSRLAGTIDLRDLHLSSSEVSGAVFEGFNPRDNAGSFVGPARDIDRDGFADLIVLAQFGKPRFDVNVQGTGVGEGYLVYGRGRRFSGVLSLNSTGTLFRGEVFTGVPQVADAIRPSRGITTFASLSDWDGDGLRELAFGLPFTDSLPAGNLGSGTDASGFAPLDPIGYFRSGAVVVISSSAFRPELGFPGRSVMNLAEFGSLTHEGLACRNCVECACQTGFYGPKAANTACNSTYFHRNWAAVTGTPNSGSIRLGCRFSSNEPFDFFGESIAAGEFDSIIIAAPNRDPSVGTFRNAALGNSIPGAGVVSTYFVNVINGFYPWTSTQAAGGTDTWPGLAEHPAPDLIPHGGPYFYIMDDFRLFDSSVGILEGSPGYWVDPDQGEPCTVETSRNAPNPARTTRFWGGFEGANIGGVASIRDFNADGLQDILVGSPSGNDGAGSCFIVLGRLRNLVMAAEMAIEELGKPQNSSNPSDVRLFDGIRVVGGANDRLGQSQASAGDFNNDGIGDVLIGSPQANNGQGGAAVFYGSRDVINLTEEEIPFSEIPSRGLGVIFVGENDDDLAGARVASAGDVDGDGNSDILIAAPNRSVRLDTDLDGTLEIDRTECGVVYLIYGSSRLQGTISLADIGTEKLPGAVFVGRRSGDHLGGGLGAQGDRSYGIAGAGDVDGDGLGDLLLSSVTASPKDRVAAGEAYLIYGGGD